MEIVSITPTGYKVLEALNTYRFLTVQQMIRLDIARDEGNLRKVLGRMVSAQKDQNSIPRPKEIGVIDFGAIPGIGRLSRLYFLAPKGADELANLTDRPDVPVKAVEHAVRFQNDYQHRVNTVDFHITLAQFAAENGHTLNLIRQYFTRQPKTGKAPPRPSTSIPLKPGYIDPDSIYMLTDEDSTERLLLVEIANGNKVDRIAKKLPEYAAAISQGKINMAFEYGTRAPRVLWLFEHRRTMELVQQRVANDDWVKHMQAHFFFRVLSDCQPHSIVAAWYRPDGGQTDLF